MKFAIFEIHLGIQKWTSWASIDQKQLGLYHSDIHLVIVCQKSEATPFKSLSWSLQLVPFNQPLTGLNSRRERHSPKYNVLHLCVIHQAMFHANMKIALNVPYTFSKDRDVSPVFSLKATCNSDPEIGTIMFAGFSININETLEMDFVGFNRSEKIKGVQQTYPGGSQLSIFRDIARKLGSGPV
ncbi:hypothetical protein T03_9277 [Trichinella britovi]|uniref:Uncharacterized protein n=1 Tax=Trichinella britovi TaxID=45882 RepID=A0A0V1D2Z9_TRIBR|nr:hypothetical protein T03_9277 [Trichinella britovi]KRZ82800.1 hypothetical protein T08_10491 [Trichinella sp. T8]